MVGKFSINFVRMHVSSTWGDWLACLTWENVSHWTRIFYHLQSFCHLYIPLNYGYFMFVWFRVRQAQNFGCSCPKCKWGTTRYAGQLLQRAMVFVQGFFQANWSQLSTDPVFKGISFLLVFLLHNKKIYTVLSTLTIQESWQGVSQRLTSFRLLSCLNELDFFFFFNRTIV